MPRTPRSRSTRSASTSPRANARCSSGGLPASLTLGGNRRDRIAVLIEHGNVIALQDLVDVVLVLGDQLVDLVLPSRVIRAQAQGNAVDRARPCHFLHQRHERERYRRALLVIAADRTPQQTRVELAPCNLGDHGLGSL